MTMAVIMAFRIVIMRAHGCVLWGELGSRADVIYIPWLGLTQLPKIYVNFDSKDFTNLICYSPLGINKVHCYYYKKEEDHNVLTMAGM